ncbi:metalloregulator ArsR/SmtB family transcription factor [Actinoplanes sp. TRM 88003]|uniref:Metalloregulator ArsR/SmtB family transcription factor n=1 Tax=Paractinoplanes aksuensis TaxID=2939490 RepID=A0ABT1E6L9_9ACTN|nr:metalloregulator ArsR/SmtB family transcription factor [Actinoplanes aksuensis]MCO8277795.1 metalloregulator ArsR/SmtB family transcription factor [Actinoplanes aksuensis]
MQDGAIGQYEAAGELFKALSSPIRLAIVDLLATEPRYVHQLVELTGLTQPLVSQHLRVLRMAGLVRGVRQRREIAYGLVDDHVAHIVRDALTHSREDWHHTADRGSGSAA